MSKLLTIVIPSYNVEKYLEQTLDSFVDEQVLDEIEVLIVDDGSKDRTAEIGKRYEEEYPGAFKLVSKKNGGHGSTINKGIELATGKYFKVVDGDDWVYTSDFVKLVEALRNCDTDFVVTNYYEVDDVTGAKKERTFRELIQKPVWGFTELPEDILLPMHSLVIRTEILQKNQIHIDEKRFYVDIEYILFPIPYVDTVSYLDLFVYMYRVALQTQSVSIKGFQKNMQHHMDVSLHLTEFLNEYMKNGGEEEKINYILKRTAIMVAEQASIFSSFSIFDKEKKEQFKQFDRQVKEKSSLVYERSGMESGMLRMLRKTEFKCYGLIIMLSRFRNRLHRE